MRQTKHKIVITLDGIFATMKKVTKINKNENIVYVLVMSVYFSLYIS